MLLAIQPYDRVAFELGAFTIYWYGLLIGFGAFLGYLLVSREFEKRGLSKEIFADLLMWAFPIAIVSARIYYVVFEWETYIYDPARVFAIWEGGLAIHGGLLGAFVTIFVFSKKRGISFWKLTDLVAPGIILGQAVGRWGNFMNQEAHGGPVSREFLETLMIPEFIINQMYINGTYYQPTFLYESLWNFAVLAILLWLRGVNLRQGELFFTYLILYSVGRFFIEGLRTDSLMIFDVLRTAQVISLILIFSSLFLIWYRRKNGFANRSYLDDYYQKTEEKK
ncbi:prolipoprotein diacylglyceryl transferase [Thalassobacillus sp. C254]|uniref:prolipoprotein diacylglyceryl transferase n=1 Tax=Thalassobacillus sp. C254 TaxID=1225341 RepID=UPI0006D11BFA|nr:prolipoprotein diacylglyceryl transferase [Thalassobacillus sp. C254]